MTPVEHAYQQLDLAATDPEQALARFEALIAVFGGSSESPIDKRADKPIDKRTDQCLELARQQAARLRPEVERLIDDQQAAIREQLARAEELASTDRSEAEKIWRGLITLYGDKSWAKRPSPRRD